MGWKSTSFTTLRCPGKRYLSLNLAFLSHLIPNVVVSYTYTNPSPLPHVAIAKSGLHAHRNKFPLFPCYPLLSFSLSSYRMASHQLQTAIRSLEIRVYIPNTQTRIQRMAHSRNSKNREHFTDSLHPEPIECR